MALVTGGARRIGATIVKDLHAKGWFVCIHYHQSDKEAQHLMQDLNAIRPASAAIFKADLRDPVSYHQLVQAVLNERDLSLLVNNASIFSAENADNDQMWKVNVQAPYDLSLAFFESLKKTQGNIVNITDIHAQRPLKGYAWYCQTKAALTMQTMSLAREFAPSVRVNAVAPGSILWPEGENILSIEQRQQILAKTLLSGHGNPEYIAQAVLSFIDNAFVTGQILAVDGGRSLVT